MEKLFLTVRKTPRNRKVSMEQTATCSAPRKQEQMNDKGKGKFLPRIVQEGPEGEQMYSSNLPSTSALDGGGWSTPCPGRFTPGKDPLSIV